MDSVSLERAQVMQAHLRVLSRVVVLLSEDFECLQDALDEIAQVIRQEMRYGQFAIWMVDDNGILRFHAGYGLTPELERTLTVKRGQGLVGWVLEHEEPVVVADVQQDSRYRLLMPETRSEMCVPLRTRQGVIGVINVESTELNAFNAHDVKLLTMLANSASGLLQRALKQEKRQRAQSEKMSGLTPRQAQILGLLADGASNQQIAHTLKIKVHTVEHHVTAILQELQLGSRYEAAQWARENRVFEENL